MPAHYVNEATLAPPLTSSGQLRLTNAVDNLGALIYSKHNVLGIRTAFKVFSKVKRSQINQKGRKANAGLTN